MIPNVLHKLKSYVKAIRVGGERTSDDQRLVSPLSEEFAKYLKYVRNLDFFETPNVSHRAAHRSHHGRISLSVRIPEKAVQRSHGRQKLRVRLQFRLARENAQASFEGNPMPPFR